MGIEDDLRSRIGELEAENEKLREEGHLTEAEIIEILDGNAAFLDKRHAEIDAIEQRAEQAEAKLRELAEAAAWRAECLEAVDYCLKQRNACIYINNTSESFWERWSRSFWHSTKLFEQAEADYQAALKAAIGDLYENN